MVSRYDFFTDMLLWIKHIPNELGDSEGVFISYLKMCLQKTSFVHLPRSVLSLGPRRVIKVISFQCILKEENGRKVQK